MNPTTGEIWETEHGPQGGDELNILQPGRNYGWPIVTFGHNYGWNQPRGKAVARRTAGPVAVLGPFHSDIRHRVLCRRPSARLAGQRVRGRNGDGADSRHRSPGANRLQRKGELRRESLLTDLHQRIRDVRQGPDGCLYLLTDEDAGALLKIEPAPPSEHP